MSSALVLGVNGQDGSYLAQNLLLRRYTVCGIARQTAPSYITQGKGFRYYSADLRDVETLSRILKVEKPTHIFHLAALHGPEGYLYETEWQQAVQVGLSSVHILLEYMRTENPRAVLIYASSGKVFGNELPTIVDEDSPRVSKCLYTITKNAAQDLIDYYRIQHSLKTSVLYFFNHESPRRSKHYFIPKVVGGLVASLKDPLHRTSVKSLDFYCDWGDAVEYSEIAIDIAERGFGKNYAVATGKTWFGRDLVDTLFARHGLDYCDYIVTERSDLPHNKPYSVRLDRLRKAIGRIPQRSVLDVCDGIFSVVSACQE